jgi:hypothetical protein
MHCKMDGSVLILPETPCIDSKYTLQIDNPILEPLLSLPLAAVPGPGDNANPQ